MRRERERETYSDTHYVTYKMGGDRQTESEREREKVRHRERHTHMYTNG